MNLPTFLCVGTQKAGTTSLYNILIQHSEIFLPEIKELHFFDREENFNKGINWYKQHFANSEDYKIRGEITPIYMYLDFIPKRIYNEIGRNTKIIFMLRNPADRAFSHYKMSIGRGFENNRFKNAIESELAELQKKEYNLQLRYIDRGFYDIQIKRYTDLFDQKNLFFILFEEDFLKNRKQTIKNLLKFLQVNENENIGVNVKSTPGGTSKYKKANKILNTAHPINQFAKKIIPSKKLRTNIKYFITKLNQKPTADKSELEEIRPFLINEIYKDSILELEKLINRNLSSWYKF